jgi:hypothetical protein
VGYGRDPADQIILIFLQVTRAYLIDVTGQEVSAHDSLNTTKNPVTYLIFKTEIYLKQYPVRVEPRRYQITYGLRTKKYDYGGARLSEEVKEEKPVQPKKVKTKEDKQAEHIARIKRTLIASLIGIGTGASAYYLGGIPDAAGLQKDGLLGFMLMLAGIVIQKHIFILIGMDTDRLGWKDWFYQSFMTFAFWFMTWAILLTSLTP